MNRKRALKELDSNVEALGQPEKKSSALGIGAGVINSESKKQRAKPAVIIDLTLSDSGAKHKKARNVRTDPWWESPEKEKEGWTQHLIKTDSSSSSSSSSSSAARSSDDLMRQQGLSLRVRSKQPPSKSTSRVTRTLPLPRKGVDPRFCLDRIDDMYQVYYDLEEGSAPQHGYMERQVDINSRMRSILVDWLIEVHHKFKLESSTLWLCINILDRYLELESVARADLQLVGVTALLIACKFEEIYPPEVRECIYITDYAYTHAQVLEMETLILTKLKFNICVPTGFHFLTRFLEGAAASERTRCLAQYYAERNMQEYDVLRFKPHVYAAASVYLALKQQAQHSTGNRTSDKCWPEVLKEESGLGEADLVSCARLIIKHVKEEPETASKRRLNAVKKKYSGEKFQFVATVPLPSLSE